MSAGTSSCIDHLVKSNVTERPQECAVFVGMQALLTAVRMPAALAVLLQKISESVIKLVARKQQFFNTYQ